VSVPGRKKTAPREVLWNRSAKPVGKKRGAKDITISEDIENENESRDAKKRRLAALRETLFGQERRDREPGGATVTENRSVSSSTRVRYSEAISPFLIWALKNHLQVGTDEGLTDAAANDFAEDLFFSGNGVEKAEVLLAAILWKFPGLRRGTSKPLPRLRRNIHGWKKVHPPKTRKPIPRLGVALIVDALIRAGHLRLGIGVWASLEFYLRPGELFGIRMCDIHPPNPVLGAGGRKLTLHLHPEEMGVPSKTGVFDSSLALDLDRDAPLAAVLTTLAQTRPRDEYLVPLDYQPASRYFAAAVRTSGLSLLAPVLYSMRHSGPSQDIHDGLRDLRAVKARGRWAADSSVRRYEKGAILNRETMRLPAATRARGLSALANIGAILVGAWSG